MINGVTYFSFVLQDDIIGPVRKALDYYTDMQKALEEEKKRKNSAELAKQNGILNSNQCKV